jgi:5-methylcytosine-specific restriction endonuclease McrA
MMVIISTTINTMPKIYKRNCDKCGEYYIGQGRNFCSRRCALLGKYVSEETKKRMSVSMKGKKHNYTYKLSDEQRKERSIQSKRLWEDKDYQNKIIEGNKRYWNTDKGKCQREKLSENTRLMWELGKLTKDLFPLGDKHWNWNPDRIRVYRKGVYFTKKQRKELLKDECEWCGSRDNLQLDHITAIINGGTNIRDNAQTLCRECNNLKRDIIDFRGRKNKRG